MHPILPGYLPAFNPCDGYGKGLLPNRNSPKKAKR
jgi:hypothetical protein